MRVKQITAICPFCRTKRLNVIADKVKVPIEGAQRANSCEVILNVTQAECGRHPTVMPWKSE